MRLHLNDFRSCSNRKASVYGHDEAKKSIRRFKSFYSQFKSLGIAKELTGTIDNWSYDKLDEVNRIAPLIKKKMKSNGII